MYFDQTKEEDKLALKANRYFKDNVLMACHVPEFKDQKLKPHTKRLFNMIYIAVISVCSNNDPVIVM